MLVTKGDAKIQNWNKQPRHWGLMNAHTKTQNWNNKHPSQYWLLNAPPRHKTEIINSPIIAGYRMHAQRHKTEIINSSIIAGYWMHAQRHKTEIINSPIIAGYRMHMLRPEELAVLVVTFAFFSCLSCAKHFHKRMVSSAAMLATVWPSGDMHRLRMRPEWPEKHSSDKITKVERKKVHHRLCTGQNKTNLFCFFKQDCKVVRHILSHSRQAHESWKIKGSS